MIFEPNAVCAPLFCAEHTAVAGQALTLAQAPLLVVLLSSGRMTLETDAQTLLLTPGGVLLAAGTATLACTEDAHLAVAGLGGSAPQQLAQKLQAPLVAGAASCPLAGQALGALLSAQARGVQDEALSPLCYAVLCAVARADSAAHALPPLVAQAVQAMRENYAGLYGVEELSAQLGVSKSHLVRVFSAAMGLSPGRYLTRVRVEAARQLLARRDYTLDVVASLCGFSGANYLCKVFKKETGLTPAACRAQGADSAAQHEAVSAWEQALYI